MRVAVVILNWNGLHLLKQYLPKVLKYSPNAKIYIIDNASTDDSIKFLEQYYPQIQCIQLPQNVGFAGGYNQGLKQVKEDICLLLNNDVCVTENWIQAITKTFEQYKKVGIVQPKILDAKNKEYFEYAGAAGGYIDYFGYPYCRGRIFETTEKDEGQYDKDTEIFWASGACFAIRKKVFKELGGFDKQYFAHQEEIDLCWRAYNEGYTIRYCSKSSVYHVGGGTLQSISPKKTFFNFRNSLYNLLKNVAFPKNLGIIFIRLILDGIAALRFICLGQWQHAFAILKAHLSFYQNFYSILKKNKISTKQYYHCKSILYKYFIQKKKRFIDIS